MKKIQEQLIVPFVVKMEKEWQELYEKVSGSPSTDAKKLCPVVQEELNKLRDLAAVDSTGSGSDIDDVHNFLRESKMNFRSVERKWKRCLVSAERTKTRLSNHQSRLNKLKTHESD